MRVLAALQPQDGVQAGVVPLGDEILGDGALDLELVEHCVADVELE